MGEIFISGESLSRGEFASVLSGKIKRLEYLTVDGKSESAMKLMTND